MFPKSFTSFLVALAAVLLLVGCAADDPLNINEPEVQPYLPLRNLGLSTAH